MLDLELMTMEMADRRVGMGRSALGVFLFSAVKSV